MQAVLCRVSHSKSIGRDSAICFYRVTHGVRSAGWPGGNEPRTSSDCLRHAFSRIARSTTRKDLCGSSLRPRTCRCRCFLPVHSVTDRWSSAKRKASEWGAWVEVMFGMILVAELLLPRRFATISRSLVTFFIVICVEYSISLA